jgi:hypothetical protein
VVVGVEYDVASTKGLSIEGSALSLGNDGWVKLEESVGRLNILSGVSGEF